MTEQLRFHFSLSCTGEGNGNPLQFLPGESQGQRSLVGCHLWGRAESDTTEVTLQQQQQQHGIPMRERDKFNVEDGGLGRRTPKEFASEKPYLFDLGHKG